MKSNLARWPSAVFAAVIVLAACDAAHACAVCFGDKDDPLVKGAASGVLLMIVVTYAVVLGFCGLMATWFVRARRIARADQREAGDS